jgi:hypothetical protein
LAYATYGVYTFGVIDASDGSLSSAYSLYSDSSTIDASSDYFAFAAVHYYSGTQMFYGSYRDDEE